MNPRIIFKGDPIICGRYLGYAKKLWALSQKFPYRGKVYPVKDAIIHITGYGLFIQAVSKNLEILFATTDIKYNAGGEPEHTVTFWGWSEKENITPYGPQPSKLATYLNPGSTVEEPAEWRSVHLFRPVGSTLNVQLTDYSQTIDSDTTVAGPTVVKEVIRTYPITEPIIKTYPSSEYEDNKVTGTVLTTSMTATLTTETTTSTIRTIVWHNFKDHYMTTYPNVASKTVKSVPVEKFIDPPLEVPYPDSLHITQKHQSGIAYSFARNQHINGDDGSELIHIVKHSLGDPKELTAAAALTDLVPTRVEYVDPTDTSLPEEGRRKKQFDIDYALYSTFVGGHANTLTQNKDSWFVVRDSIASTDDVRP